MNIVDVCIFKIVSRKDISRRDQFELWRRCKIYDVQQVKFYLSTSCTQLSIFHQLGDNKEAFSKEDKIIFDLPGFFPILWSVLQNSFVWYSYSNLESKSWIFAVKKKDFAPDLILSQVRRKGINFKGRPQFRILDGKPLRDAFKNVLADFVR